MLGVGQMCRKEGGLGANVVFSRPGCRYLPNREMRDRDRDQGSDRDHLAKLGGKREGIEYVIK